MDKYPLPNKDTDPLRAVAMYARYGMMYLRFGETNRGYTAMSNILCELSRMEAVYNDSDEVIDVDCKQMHELDLEDDNMVLLHRSMLYPKESLIQEVECRLLLRDGQGVNQESLRRQRTERKRVRANCKVCRGDFERWKRVTE